MGRLETLLAQIKEYQSVIKEMGDGCLKDRTTMRIHYNQGVSISNQGHLAGGIQYANPQPQGQNNNENPPQSRSINQ